MIEIPSTAPMPDVPCAEGLAAVDAGDLARAAPDRHLLVVDDRGRLRARGSCWWQQVPEVPGERAGLIGHYAAADGEAAAALLDAASSLLARAGCTSAIGPMDGSTWRRYRFVIERGTEPPFFLEPDNPDEWPAQFETAGFRTLATYTSALNEDLAREEPSLERTLARFTDEGTVIRPFDPRAADVELGRIFGLSLESFRHNFLYTPIGESEFMDANRRVLPMLRPELVLLAERDGELAGFLFAVPDLLQVSRTGATNTFIIKTVAVAQGRRNAGLGRLLVSIAHREGHRLGFTRAIHALMHEDNVSRNISRRSATTMRRYALFIRRLAPPTP